MDWSDILRRIGEGEGAETEFQGRLTGYRKTICALANGRGGVLILGVEDDGAIVGIGGDPEEVQERLTSFLHNGCGAPLVADVGLHRHEGRWVHWVALGPQGKRGGPFQCDGRYWTRRGRATVAPSHSELQELFNHFAVVITEEQIIFGTTIDDAVIHRDYAITGSKVFLEVFGDRVVVTSPGRLPNHMGVENARSGGNPRSRNEMMANAMATKGYMEGRDRGWLMMRREMRRFNGTEPEMTNDTINRFVSVTFRLSPQ